MDFLPALRTAALLLVFAGFLTPLNASVIGAVPNPEYANEPDGPNVVHALEASTFGILNAA
jgi:hypothetical protein